MRDGIFLSTEMITEVLKFASKSDMRNPLQGLWIDASDKQKPIIEATDGHRLHRIQTDELAQSPPDTYNLTKTALKDSGKRVALAGYDVTEMLFKLKEIEAISKMRRKGRYSTGGFENMRVKFSQKRILFIAKDKILIRYIKPTIDDINNLGGEWFGINTKYLIQALQTFVNKSGVALDIEMRFKDRLSPVVLKPVGADYPLHIVMPVQIK